MAGDEMKKHQLLASACFALITSFGSGAFALDADLPPNAVPGKCYQRVLIPEVLEYYEDRIIDTPERTEIRVIPAVYGDEVRTVTVREGRTEFITVAATYRTVTETVTIRPASYRIETVAARYETITERVLIREAYAVWKRGVPPSARPNDPNKIRTGAGGEVLCLVEVPAEYAMVTRQVLREPAREVRIDIPAETRVITRSVIDQPARVDKREIAAEYAQVTVRVLKSPERTETYTIPATYKTVRKQRLIKASHFEWAEAVCEQGPPPPPPRLPPPPKYVAPPPPKYVPPPRPMGRCDEVDVTATTVRDLQTALGMRNYYSGARNGVFNAATTQALHRFQTENRLAVGRIDGPTLRALGVPYTSGCAAVGERG
jgi:hypothetical protein